MHVKLFQYLLLTAFLLSLLKTYAQESKCAAKYCSQNGTAIQPEGTLRILNIFINVVYDATPEADIFKESSHPEDGWKAGAPNSINFAPPRYLHRFLDVDLQQGELPEGTMTRKYYEASFGKLVLLGDYMAVNVLQSSVKERSERGFTNQELVNAAIKQINDAGGIKTLYGHNSISDYDRATVSFSKAGEHKQMEPDGKIDFLQFFFRNTTTKYGGQNTGTGRTGFSLTNMRLHKIKIDTTYYDASCVSIQAIGESDITTLANGIIVHEFSHNLLGGNNFHASGGNHRGSYDHGWFLGLQGGYGIMAGHSSSLTSCNAYERWRLGWTSDEYNPEGIPIAAADPDSDRVIVSDISKKDGNRSFILRDFVTTGDAIRIRLPYVDPTAKNQYIWLENHQVGKNEMLDYMVYSNTNDCRNSGTPGTYSYIQIGKDILESENKNEVFPNNEADNLRQISAEGNFDYEFVEKVWVDCVRGEMQFKQKRVFENPLSGYTDQEEKYFSSEKKLEFKDRQTTDHLVLMDGGLVTDLPFLGDNRDAFTGNTVMDIGSNPAPVPMITYSSNRAEQGSVNSRYNNRRTYLSGLSIGMQELNNGTFKVDIKWDHYEVKNDVRWTGDIVLKEQLILAEGHIILLDQNFTPNQNTRDSESGQFSKVTELSCEAGSVIQLKDGASMVLDNNSKLYLKKGSTIQFGADNKIYLKNGSQIIFEEGTTVLSDDKVKIYIERNESVIDISDGGNYQNKNNLKIRKRGNAYFERVL